MRPHNLIGDPPTPDDLAALAKSWLPPGLVDQACIRRVDEQTARQELGRNGSSYYAGLAFPYIYPGSQHVCDWRVRRDLPDLDSNDRETAKYLTAPGRGNRLYFPPGTTSEMMADTSLPVVITEGEKKALALWRLATEGQETPRWLAVGIPGVWNWRGTIGKGYDAAGARCDVKGVIPDFDHLAWEGRSVCIVFDANVHHNDSVSAARRGLSRESERRGAHVRLVDLPRDAGINGVDDLLVSRGPAFVLNLMALAGESEPPSFAHTDLGNAERLIHRHGRNLRYCHAWRKWLHWNGRRWCVDDTAEVERLAADTVRAAYADASRIDDAEQRKALASWCRKSESDRAIKAMLNMARSLEGVPVRPDELDADPWALNCENGTIDLSTGKLRNHRREDLLTKSCHVVFNPAAQAPTLLAFLDRIMAGNGGLVGFLQRAVGYALTGDTSEQVVFIFWGSGANGKSTLCEHAVMPMLGDYALPTPAETLLAKQHDSIPNDLARLKGARFVVATETDDGRRLAESRLKQMTGGDRMSARFLHAEWFDFLPEFKIFLTTNHKPDVRGTDHAIWRRIRLVPFTVAIPAEEQDHKLPEKLQAEMEGILAWAVRGCLAWQRDGLGLPEEVKAATQEYREETDRIGRFLDDRCVRGDSVQVKARALYQDYKRWTDEAGETTLTETAFGRRLGDLGISKRRGSGGITYDGIGLMASN